MSALREAARGQHCKIRLPCCNHNPETTVSAHFRSVSLGAGMGIKPADIFAADACSACHDAVDGRRHVEGYERVDILHAFLMGVLRTIDQRIRDGLIRIDDARVP